MLAPAGMEASAYRHKVGVCNADAVSGRSSLPENVAKIHSVNLFVAAANSSNCDGFRMPAQHRPHHAHRRAGVRKPPGNEGAGSGAPGSAGAMGNWLTPLAQQVSPEAALGRD